MGGGWGNEESFSDYTVLYGLLVGTSTSVLHNIPYKNLRPSEKDFWQMWPKTHSCFKFRNSLSKMFRKLLQMDSDMNKNGIIINFVFVLRSDLIDFTLCYVGCTALATGTSYYKHAKNYPFSNVNWSWPESISLWSSVTRKIRQSL